MTAIAPRTMLFSNVASVAMFAPTSMRTIVRSGPRVGLPQADRLIDDTCGAVERVRAALRREVDRQPSRSLAQSVWGWLTSLPTALSDVTLEERGGIFLNVPKQRVSARRKRIRLVSTRMDPVRGYTVCPDCGAPVRAHCICLCLTRRLPDAETLVRPELHVELAKTRGVVIPDKEEIRTVFRRAAGVEEKTSTPEQK